METHRTVATSIAATSPMMRQKVSIIAAQRACPTCRLFVRGLLRSKRRTLSERRIGPLAIMVPPIAMKMHVFSSVCIQFESSKDTYIPWFPRRVLGLPLHLMSNKSVTRANKDSPLLWQLSHPCVRNVHNSIIHKLGTGRCPTRASSDNQFRVDAHWRGTISGIQSTV